MPALNWVARWPFGSLSVLDADTHPPHPEDSAILCWAIHIPQKAVRLSLAHRGVLIHLVLRSDTTYGKLVYDTVEPTWQRKQDDYDFWVPRQVDQHTFSLSVQKAEDDILDLCEQSSTRIFEQAQLGDPPTGSQLWAEVDSDSDSTDASGGPQVNLVGDLFRELLVRDLPFISDHDFADLPKIDISAIAGYHLKRRYMKDSVLSVLASTDSTTQPTQLILKTIEIPTSFRESTDSSSLMCPDEVKLFRGELEILSTLTPHPNVMPAPLALVTIRIPERSSGDSVFHEGSKDSPKTKLVGWLHHHHRDWLGKSPFTFRTKKAATYKLRYAYELCCGIQHLVCHGFYHPDLGVENTLFAGTPPNDRLMVMDFEPFEDYRNKNGPEAPEVVGHWNPSINENGDLVYIRSDDEPVYRGNTIFNDWKEMPEALERLIVFNLGSALGKLLDIRLVFPWTTRSHLRRGIQLLQAPEVGADPARDVWEDLIPDPIREMTQRCSAFDPRERPLLQELVAALQQYGRADTGSASFSGGTTS
ncbi:hypothetical protein CF319_g4241 [Tilletia indica]|nr:hypothetical protein CF319_g4241 [Tilletia indica]